MPRSRLGWSGFRESFLIAATGDDVAFGSKGDISAELTHVRFTPKSGHSELFDYLVRQGYESRWHR